MMQFYYDVDLEYPSKLLDDEANDVFNLFHYYDTNQIKLTSKG